MCLPVFSTAVRELHIRNPSDVELPHSFMPQTGLDAPG